MTKSEKWVGCWIERKASVEPFQEQPEKKKQHGATDAVQDRHDCRNWLAYLEQIQVLWSRVGHQECFRLGIRPTQNRMYVWEERKLSKMDEESSWRPRGGRGNPRRPGGQVTLCELRLDQGPLSCCRS